MFDFATQQASASIQSALSDTAWVFPVAATARPGQGYEVLCTLASQLSAAGREVVIIDGSAQEVSLRRSGDGHHFGLVHALEDTSIVGLGAPGADSEWLVMPGAKGLQVLQRTARAAGAGFALSKLLAPFSPSTLVLVYAPAHVLCAILAGLSSHAMVPVLDLPQATVDAYGSVKLLHAAGLTPVLAPMAFEDASAKAPLSQVVRTVVDCTDRYLHYDIAQWPILAWSEEVQTHAFCAPWPPGTQPKASLAALGRSTIFPASSQTSM